ncbi:ankyrin repeat-containing protein At5g02620-like [Ziziphus jujuba]|uniref:Ankyrin repeat-containing protein At5g02620-like n=1 Tax=Ziziphus jujuba TaxID=326968 RepID=A0ABM4A9D3_ZIZJJ|nr:ankyrin repeat-containing protein At5g02620-like [Ziziphus jujuba]
MDIRTESVRELNKDGFGTLDIASTSGHIEIVREIILRSTGTARKQVCGSKGREGRTAIHYAAINGKVEVMDKLFIAWAGCIRDDIALGETTFHLAVKYKKFEAFRNLIEWMKFLCLEELMNCGDEDGYTVLHLAHVQLQLSCNSNTAKNLEVNAKNKRGLTAMDIMDILILENSTDFHLRQIIHQHAGAASAQLQHAAINVANNQEHGPTQPSPAFQMDPDVVEDEKKQDGIKMFMASEPKRLT